MLDDMRVFPDPRLVATADSRRAGIAAVLLWFPGMVLMAAAVSMAYAVHLLIPAIGVLIVAVLLGIVLANCGAVHQAAMPGLTALTKRALRFGVVLLGLSLSFSTIAALGFAMVLLIASTVSVTLVVTVWLGQRLGLSRSRSLLIGTGFSICGASAVAGMEQAAEADEEDVTVAITMVTLYGSIMMIVLPLMQSTLRLDDQTFGAWAGASIHEVGQVVGAAGAVGPAALAVAVAVKLTRVMMLAPAVAVVGIQRRRNARAQLDLGQAHAAKLPPLVPAFVVGFLVCMLIRSSGLLPDGVLSFAFTLQTILLGAALFGMGTTVRLGALLRGGGRVLVLSAASTALIGGITLGGVLAIL